MREAAEAQENARGEIGAAEEPGGGAPGGSEAGIHGAAAAERGDDDAEGLVRLDERIGTIDGVAAGNQTRAFAAEEAMGGQHAGEGAEQNLAGLKMA